MFIDFIVNHSLISIPVTAYIIYAVLDLIVVGLRKTGIKIKNVSIKRKILYLILFFFGAGIIELFLFKMPIFFGVFILFLRFPAYLAYILLLFIITLAIYEKIKKINRKFQLFFLLICILLFIPKLEFSNLKVLKCQFSLNSQIGSTNLGYAPLFATLITMNSIGIKNPKTICYRRVALNTENPSLCKSSDCFLALAKKTKNALLCENIKILHSKKYCYESLGIDVLPIAEKYFITCNSCSDCTTKIDNALPETVVRLNSDLYYKDDKECINLKDVEKIVFDCQNYKIISQTGDGIGINIQDSTINTIKNCVINNFDIGIQIKDKNADYDYSYLLNNAGYNHLLNNVIEKNNRYGISIICENPHKSPRGNTLIQNRVCNNFDQDIFAPCSAKGIKNTCDKTFDDHWGYDHYWHDDRNSYQPQEKGCIYKCDKVEN